MKVCSDCKKEKPLSEFNKEKKSKDGFAYVCRECSRKKQRIYKKKYKAKKKKEKELQQKTEEKTVVKQSKPVFYSRRERDREFLIITTGKEGYDKGSSLNKIFFTHHKNFNEDSNNFSPFWLKAFINEFNITSLYDPFGGWGNKLLGAWNIDYIYNDIESETVSEVKSIFKNYLSRNVKLKKFYNEDASQFSPEESYDAVIIYPPQDNKKSINNPWWNNVIKNCKPKKYLAVVMNEDNKDKIKKIISKEYSLVKEIPLKGYSEINDKMLIVFKTKYKLHQRGR